MFFWAVISLFAGVALGAETVRVPAGEIAAFWLAPTTPAGKDWASAPRSPVKAFDALKYAVTVQDFQKFLKKHPEWSREKVSQLQADESYLSGINFKTLNPKTPVTSVSWFAARAYCADLGMRLPTVEEWEYLAAASETAADANRDEVFLRRILEWYGEPRGKALKTVGSVYRNLYGAWDLHGVIWEWVDDFNSSFVTGESREDSSFNKDMFCGSGAMSSSDRENYAGFMRFAFRSSLKGRSSVWNLGFRCVRSVP